MRWLVLSVFVSAAAAAACGGGSGDDDGGPDAAPDAEPAPVFRNPVALPDDELALQALQILGANVTASSDRCSAGCHGLTRAHIRYWRALSDTSYADCLVDLQVSGGAAQAQQMIDCFRIDPATSGSMFATTKLGVWASAVRLPWFQYLFRVAYPGGTVEYDGFEQRVAMPKMPAVNPQMTQGEFDIVAEWFLRGVPQLDAMLPEDPPPDECLPGVSADVDTHVAAMATEGWRAKNSESGLNMYNLSAAPLASSTTYGAQWDRAGLGQNRILWEGGASYSSDFWTRSSADGRFFAHGGGQPGFASTIIDLQAQALIEVQAAYDPAFFPDNSGFVFQGGGGGNVCAQSILNGTPAVVTMNEPGCNALGSVDLYEHVGAVYGGDYFNIDGEFVSDSGGHAVTLGDPPAFFDQTSQLSVTPLIFDGANYQPKPSVVVDIPFEGDTVISPSARMLISRVSGPGNDQLGFVLRNMIATPNGPSYSITAPEVARYCVNGGKPAFSYDERWIVYHHYITNSAVDAVDLGFTGTGDPGFAPYANRGTANIYLIEAATGQIQRITNMRPGQYALYPHFRSDGWIYYQVRDIGAPGGGDETEYSVALDTALLLE
jgi:hypothetical protein